MKTDTVRSCETLVNLYQTTQYHISEHGTIQSPQLFQLFHPEVSTWQLQRTLAAIRVFVCIYKQLLVSQLLISTTSVKLSHIRDNTHAWPISGRTGQQHTSVWPAIAAYWNNRSGKCGNMYISVRAQPRHENSGQPLCPSTVLTWVLRQVQWRV
jgi:hypothetical protein